MLARFEFAPPPPNGITMNPIPVRIILLFLSLSSLVAAANFTQCLEDFKQTSNSITDGGVDSQGRPVSPADAVGLTYQTCVAWCGTGTGNFVWSDFARSFSSWLLPWLALLTQLPFGSSNYVDDFVSGWFSFRLSRFCRLFEHASAPDQLS